MYYLSISVMCFLFFCVMIAGYLEYDRIIRCRCITMMVTGFHHSVDRGTEGHVMNYGKVFDLKSIALKPSFHNTDLNPSSGISGLITSEQSVEISGNSSAMNLVEHLSPTNSQTLLKQPSNCQTFFGGSSGSCVSSSRRRESVCAKDKEVCTHASSNTGICKSGNGKRKGRKKSVTLHQPADEACFKITPSRVNQSFSSVKKSSSGESIPRQPTLDCPKSSLCQDNHGNESNALNFRKSCFDYRQHKENIGWAGERTDAKNKHDDKTKLSEVDRCRVNKRRHVAIVDPMEEETSSTTTESSCADVDSSEKVCNFLCSIRHFCILTWHPFP